MANLFLFVPVVLCRFSFSLSLSLMPGITIGRGFGKDPTLSLGGSLQYVGRPKLRVASADLQKVCNKWFQVDVDGNRLPDQRCA